ncbi:hypothetical protein B5C34_02800 [Pacificimonas flava]|uniref:FecR protein domain-containing protein n=2 Tax=Pacificimonas TaxID=1960290 RepID=A0A219B3W5_9SPHN|nr:MULTISPECIES: FecR domain-containing protein [Pacificimonas]MBZ6377849.1 FecR domain-containing protein [Pacificimonas aurantium]OWV32488.1 hypothetical protein B5C34_02800 [Pacificimonas flava]
MTDVTHREDEALIWIIRMRDPAFADWDGFTAWLEGSPRNASTFDEMALAEEEAVGLLETWNAGRPANDEGQAAALRTTMPRRAFFGAAVAAAVLASIGGYSLIESEPELSRVEVAAGARQSVTLEDGSRIELNGPAQLAYVPDGRSATLLSGEAHFEVVHDESQPFVVEVKGRRVVDMGTAFNIAVGQSILDIEVSEGRVSVDPADSAIELEAGEALTISGSRAVRRKVSPQNVASWRSGRLVYANAPLSLVARDVGRNLGTDIRLDASLAGSSFTGTIQLEGKAEDLVPVIGRLAGGQARREGAVWILSKD